MSGPASGPASSPVGPAAGDVRAGVYRHWKGRYYLLLGLAHDADVDGREVVVYVGLYVDPALPGPRMSVRTRASFFSEVQTPAGPAPRFAYVAATLTAADLDAVGPAGPD